MERVTTRALRHAAADEVSALLTVADPAGLVRSLRDSDDADLRDLVGDPARGRAVVEGVLRRLGEYAVPAQLRGVVGTVLWEPSDLAGDPWTVGFDDGSTRLLADGAPGEADLGVRGSAVDLLRMVAGQLDLALGYLGGTLELRGDCDLALAVAAIFAADGTAPVSGEPVDPRAIDPVAVAGVLRGVGTDHLRSVMASGFRPVILDEVFRRMPSYVNDRKASGLQVTVGFRLTGRPDGEVDRYVLRLEGGRATVLAGPGADAVDRDDRDATVTCEAHDLLRLVTGNLSPVTGVLRGQLKVRGDKAAALRVSAAFDIPTAAAG